METEQPTGMAFQERGGRPNEKHEHKNHVVTVSVNEHPVKMVGHTATGTEIKTAAIEQGVDIQLNFVLEEDLSDGTRRAGGRS